MVIDYYYWNRMQAKPVNIAAAGLVFVVDSALPASTFVIVTFNLFAWDENNYTAITKCT